MDKKTALILAFFFLLIPAVSFANAGTPLMWVTFFHLTLGNLVIGIVEGILLSYWFGSSRWKSILLMIIANYFSAYIGSLLIGLGRVYVFQIKMSNMMFFVAFLYILFYLFTLVLEYPFVWFLFRKQEGWVKKSLLASLLIQTLSNLILFSFYYSVSETQLLSGNKVISVEEMTLPKSVDVYYIGVNDGDVYKISLADFKRNKVAGLGSTNDFDYLYQVSDDHGQSNLMVYSNPTASEEGDLAMVKESVGPFRVYSSGKLLGIDGQWTYRNFTSYYIGPMLQLDDAKDSHWYIDCYYGWRGEFVGRQKSEEKKKFQLSFETPFIILSIGNAMHLPSDIIVFQVGKDEIYLFDPEEQKLAFLAKGYGPTAVVRKEE